MVSRKPGVSNGNSLQIHKTKTFRIHVTPNPGSARVLKKGRVFFEIWDQMNYLPFLRILKTSHEKVLKYVVIQNTHD